MANNLMETSARDWPLQMLALQAPAFVAMQVPLAALYKANGWQRTAAEYSRINVWRRREKSETTVWRHLATGGQSGYLKGSGIGM